MPHPNKLAAYLAEKGIAQADFARSTGIQPAVLTRYVQGVRRPGLENALAIDDATGGKVPASYWRDFVPTRRRRKANAKTKPSPVPVLTGSE